MQSGRRRLYGKETDDCESDKQKEGLNDGKECNEEG